MEATDATSDRCRQREMPIVPPPRKLYFMDRQIPSAKFLLVSLLDRLPRAPLFEPVIGDADQENLLPRNHQGFLVRAIPACEPFAGLGDYEKMRPRFFE